MVFDHKECSVEGCKKAGVQRCSRCKMVYCSAACQRRDWAEHKTYCKALAADVARVDAELTALFPQRAAEGWLELFHKGVVTITIAR